MWGRRYYCGLQVCASQPHNTGQPRPAVCVSTGGTLDGGWQSIMAKEGKHNKEPINADESPGVCWVISSRPSCRESAGMARQWMLVIYSERVNYNLTTLKKSFGQQGDEEREASRNDNTTSYSPIIRLSLSNNNVDPRSRSAPSIRTAGRITGRLFRVHGGRCKTTDKAVVLCRPPKYYIRPCAHYKGDGPCSRKRRNAGQDDTVAVVDKEYFLLRPRRMVDGVSLPRPDWEPQLPRWRFR